jgi:lipid-A-disaccharide synthase
MADANRIDEHSWKHDDLRIFFSVGEPSGDLHGANLICDLRERHPGIRCVGYGGPRMAAAGCELIEDLTQLAVMGFSRVLTNLHRFWDLYRRADRYLREHRPDAVVLIDYPGFNWWIARAAKKYNIPVFYYGAPQMWAWAGWRVRKMRRLVDHVLCKLPFEAAWYRERGCNATYVGHPYFDQMERQILDAKFIAEYGSRPGPLVTILPGSRTQELINNLPWFLKAAKIVRERVPNARFAIAGFNDKLGEMAAQQVELSGLPIDVFVGRTPELIHASQCCLACSGSVSLELLHHTKPAAILYFVHPLLKLMVHLLGTVKYMTLVNLLAEDDPFTKWPVAFDPHGPDADQVPFPEYPTSNDKSSELAAHVIQWLSDAGQRERRITMLAELKAKFGRSGASRVAARYILEHLSHREPSLPGPHFMDRQESFTLGDASPTLLKSRVTRRD